MSCSKCNSPRVLEIQAKCSDGFGMWINNNEDTGYVPSNLGIGGGDNVEFSYCLDCGTIQGDFPIEHLEIEDSKEEDDE